MKRITTLFGSLLLLQACDSSDPSFTAPPNPTTTPPASTVMASYDVTVTNLTNAQPLSPIAIVGHNSNYAVFELGNAATVGLEQLAEGGDNSELISEAMADADNVFATASGAMPIGPAGSETVSLTLLDSNRDLLQVSVASMLVNTNDAVSVLNGFDASTMAVDDSMFLDIIAYDSGTEADTEAAADIPGPAGGGEGFNAVRDDENDRVAMHSGIVSQSDGLTSSDLTEQHRFDNPVMRVRITRTQ